MHGSAEVAEVAERPGEAGEAEARSPHVVIVGGGISGLAAAFFLRDAPVTVTVFEGSPRLGGKLAVSEVAGIAVDEGAEALLARRPEGTGLISELGLSGQLAVPATTAAAIWTRGALRPLPRGQLMGVPSDLDELARSGVLSAAGEARARRDMELPATRRDGDVPVASFVAARLGQEVVDRLVDPLLGGVYAGRSEQLSLEATLPSLAAASRHYISLTEAARSLLPPRGQPGREEPHPSSMTSIFTTLTGGLATLVPAVAAASGARLRTGYAVRGLARTPAGWRLTAGPASAPERVDADAVIVAVPARPAGRLLAGVPGAGPASAALGEIEYASMAIVTLAYPRAAFPQSGGPQSGERQSGGPQSGERQSGERQSGGPQSGGPPARGSGYLVPAVDGRAVKAVTFSTVKWPHLFAAGDAVDIVRCSIGRIGETGLLQRDDDELAALAAADLAAATGVRGKPLDARVTRWGGALPQYTVGHLDRVARIRAAVAAQPGLAVCGAAYDGLGIPACIATGRAAADRVLGYLRGVLGGRPPR